MKKIYLKIREKYTQKKEDFKSDAHERMRLMIIIVGLVFSLDYLLFCYHTERNVFGIFPDLPILSNEKLSAVYLPSIDKDEIFEEKRSIPLFPDKKELVKYYVKLISNGSNIKNTRAMVPYKLYIRNIWFDDTNNNTEAGIHCIVDLEQGILSSQTAIINNSEDLFRKAITQTIITNIPDIKRVSILTNGNPEGKLWSTLQ